MDHSSAERIEEIVRLLKEQDYDPVAQLTGYVEMGQEHFITRHGGTRDKIKEIDAADIREYLSRLKE